MEDGAHDGIRQRRPDSLDPRANPHIDLDHDAILTDAPEDRFKLGYGTVIALILNRIIGSGIFINSGEIYRSTQTVGASLMVWLAGVIYAVAGIIVYIEYGLTIPRRMVNNEDKAIPRSGADLNYLQYVYRWPAYRKDTVLLITSLFGISFIFFGTMAGNAMNFAFQVLSAANPEKTPSNAAVRGIAIGISIFACTVHTISRRGGLILNNAFAIFKVSILLVIVFITIAYSNGAISDPVNLAGQPYETKNNDTFGDFSVSGLSKGQIRNSNFNISTSFRDDPNEAAIAGSSDYANALLDVIFAFAGFEQANYVLAEISHPHRKLPRSLGISVAIVAFLYMAVNVCYWFVVPQDMIRYRPDKEGHSQTQAQIAEAFFTITLGPLKPGDPYYGKRISHVFVAISALGNIIVTTYTATRVKQEIAKEGILPWPRFFAQNYDLSIGRLLRKVQRIPWMIRHFGRIFRTRWLAPASFQERTPVGAMILHLGTCSVLIFGTWKVSPSETYLLLTGISAYLINGIFGMLLAGGILYLRFKKSRGWKTKSQNIHPAVSIVAAFLYFIINGYVVITRWFKPSIHGTLNWFIEPGVSWGVLGLGALWWLLFFLYLRRKDGKENTVLKIDKVPQYVEDPPNSGLLVQTHETTYIVREAEDHSSDNIESDRDAIRPPMAQIQPEFNDFD